eukprot:Platyproteum_vivax@DN10613_c0_g1_i1.p1
MLCCCGEASGPSGRMVVPAADYDKMKSGLHISNSILMETTQKDADKLWTEETRKQMKDDLQKRLKEFIKEVGNPIGVSLRTLDKTGKTTLVRFRMDRFCTEIRLSELPATKNTKERIISLGSVSKVVGRSWELESNLTSLPANSRPALLDGLVGLLLKDGEEIIFNLQKADLRDKLFRCLYILHQSHDYLMLKKEKNKTKKK